MAGAQTPFLIAAALTLLGAMATTPARADAVLEVAPVLLDIQAPSATGTVSVKNDNARPTTIQVRLFRWRQGDGEERYEPTQDVVASPPIADVVLPVFFAQGDRSAPQVTWSVGRGPKGYVLRAHNAGDQRLRVAQVTLTGAGQAPIKLGGGLLGYVLGHADMSWTIGKARAFRPGALTVRGESDHGEFRATASVTSSR
jgi:fimbrial chaperone protein